MNKFQKGKFPPNLLDHRENQSPSILVSQEDPRCLTLALSEVTQNTCDPLPFRPHSLDQLPNLVVFLIVLFRWRPYRGCISWRDFRFPGRNERLICSTVGKFHHANPIREWGHNALEGILGKPSPNRANRLNCRVARLDLCQVSLSLYRPPKETGLG
jgi:hypothetical protein